MLERRYSHYKQEDVWATLYQLQSALGVQVHDGTVHGNSVSLSRGGVVYQAVILARSSYWYANSLNCVERWQHQITCVVAGTHDSCLEVPVLAIDTMHWYEPKTIRLKGDTLQPFKLDAAGRAADRFEQWRKTQYGHNILLGALMCGRPDAFERLHTLPPSTQRRIHAKVKRLHLRRPGRPLAVLEDKK
ncbi:hypothetical protein [Ktedonobacter racemifer]|uniref:Uncharacterized protein n=1 Tax=Ktedonobacter racemifer DSM 44963 TaxID=485913 RepID=D6TH58_KTERA|nr:hypothetical protein [Ktedonobacter racemifer]EFH90800.1 hypothetical protein Krac_12439 [Ktedonobacter racemifer DSM 44963]